MHIETVFITITLTAVSALRPYCDLPPRFWCDSRQIAKACGMTMICANWFWGKDLDAKPVKLDVYFESLCPDSIDFIVHMLYPTWKDFYGTNITDLTMYSYGNANETFDVRKGQWSFSCQQGPRECVGNLIENCIQKYTNYDSNLYLPIFYCMESSKDPVAAAEMCTSNARLDWRVINPCANGAEGNALMHKAAMATAKLVPPHKYVPWIVINGKHSEPLQKEALMNLPKLLCDTYRGVRPSQCKKYTQPQTEFVMNRNEKESVKYKLPFN